MATAAARPARVEYHMADLAWHDIAARGKIINQGPGHAMASEDVEIGPHQQASRRASADG